LPAYAEMSGEFVICRSSLRAWLFFAKRALRVEVADAAALAPGSRVEHRVDQSGLAAVHRRVHRALELIRARHVGADAAESVYHLVVARALDEDGRRGVGAAGRVHVGTAIDAVVVEDDNADRQLVPADGLDLHAGKPEGAVAFDREHRLAGLDRRGDRISHADTHDAPSANIDALARLVHIDDAAREIERV